MEFTSLNKCPLCDSDKIGTFKKGTINTENISTDDFKITDSTYGSVWDFSKCSSCSFVFSNPRIDEKSLIEFYSELEDNEYTDEWEGREKNFRTIIKRLGKFEISGNKLLDIGAASGIFVRLAAENGYSAEGIEPSTQLAREAGEKFGIKIFEGTIDDYSSDGQFSVVTLLDLIEHVNDPAEFMDKVSPLVKKGGILVIVTPDIQSIPPKILRNRWWHYRTAHVNFFSLRSLAFLLERSGFIIEKKYRYAWNFSFYYVLTRLFPSLKKNKGLQKVLKRLNLKLQLFDSWEIYARKS
ncbi:MAG: class I SAM-dependent methyltransferase [Candidatus Aminicenantes bacterium]|nr:class I SAM-dependent methyltransferase [Candidatus Aminicenantes bacterium]